MKDFIFITADFETTIIPKLSSDYIREDQDFIIGACYNGKDDPFIFTDLNKFVAKLLYDKDEVIYFHNLDYDYRFLVSHLNKFDKKYIIRGSQLIRVELFLKDDKVFELRDSMALFPFSLKKVGKSFNTKYFKKDFDIRNIKLITDKVKKEKTTYELYIKENRNSEIIENLIDYLKLDCRVLWEALDNFRNILGQNYLNLSISSIAFSQINKFFDIKLLHNNISYDDCFRASYFGGRCEVFRHFVDDILYYYDINSLYPYVMSKYEYPIGFCSDNVNSNDHNPFFIAKIKTKIPKNIFLPPLPARVNKKLFFPYGKIEGWFNSIDISLLNYLNIPYEILKCYTFQNSGFIFNSFVGYWYNIKQNSQNNSGLYETAKLLMNSGYGKMAESNDKKEIIQVSQDQIVNWMRYKKEKGLNPFILNHELGIIESDSLSVKSFTTSHIASFITSYARRELYYLLDSIMKNDGKIYYADTDSVITNIKCNTDLNLGGLKLVDTLKEGFFALPKIYAYKNEKNDIIIKAKGGYRVIKNSAGLLDCETKRINADSISYDDIKNYVCDKKPIQKDLTRISKIKSIINGNKKDTECYYIDYHIHLTSYDKRKFDDLNNNSCSLNVEDVIKEFGVKSDKLMI